MHSQGHSTYLDAPSHGPSPDPVIAIPPIWTHQVDKEEGLEEKEFIPLNTASFLLTSCERVFALQKHITRFIITYVEHVHVEIDHFII